MRLIIFLLLPFLLQAQYTLTVCTMFKNEAQWIIEWIEYHRLLGVEHFYLYNNDTTDNTLDLLEPYLKSGLVEVIPWASTPDHWDWRGTNFDGYQIKAFNDCLSRARGNSKWVAIIDIDEYLVPVEGKESLFNLLNSPLEASTGSFELNWRIFGTSNVWEIPKDKLLIETLTYRAVDSHFWNGWKKSIHRPEAVEVTYVHQARLWGGWAIKELSADSFRVHHYWTRNEQDFFKKRIGLFLETRPDFNEIRARGESYVGLLDFVSCFNDVLDLSILSFVPAVRQALHLSPEGD